MNAISFPVRCTVCKSYLDADIARDRHGDLVIFVDPCEKCLDECREDAEGEGYKRAIHEAESTR